MRAVRLARTVSLLVMLVPAFSSAQTSAPAQHPPPPKAAPKKEAARPAPPAARGKPAAKKAPPEPPLPPAPVRLWIVAPSPDGPWTLRLDNEGTRGVRMAADIRLLRFDIDIGGKKPIRCTVPDALRPQAFPEARALLLGPGQSYIETFDPRLMCFGDSAKGLTGAAVVRSFFGWAPPGRGKKPPPGGPFVVEGIDMPETFASEREVTAPTLVLSYALPEPGDAQAAPDKQDGAPGKQEGTAKQQGAPGKQEGTAAKQQGAPGKQDGTAAKQQGAPGKQDGAPGKQEGTAAKQQPAPGNKQEGAATKGDKTSPAPASAGKTPAGAGPELTDARAARLELSAQSYAEAESARGLTISATAKNAGQRPMLVALRSRMLSFRVQGADGKETVCGGGPPTHSIPRDRFNTLKPGGTSAFTVMLSEICPRGTFPRPGLYRITATLEANESGEQVGVTAYTGTATAPKPTWVRLKTGTDPFYASPPQAVATPQSATQAAAEAPIR